MRLALLALVTASCGPLHGSNEDVALATLHLVEVHSPFAGTATVDPPTGIVWYRDASTVLVPNAPLREGAGLGHFDIDVVSLPPDAVLVSSDSHRAAIGQLVFYTGNDEDGGVDAGSLARNVVYAAPVNAVLVYLEGPAVENAAPESLLFDGQQPGFSWLRVAPAACDAGDCCGTPSVEDLSTVIDFSISAPMPSDAGQTYYEALCPVAPAVPACVSGPPGEFPPLLPVCPP